MHIHIPLLAIAIVWFFAAVPPGPNFFITVRTSLTQSRSLAIRARIDIVLPTPPLK